MLMIESGCLDKLSFCQRFSNEERNELGNILLKNAFWKELKPNESLTQLGEPVNYVYVVDKGMLRNVNYTPDGEEISFYYFTEGDMINLLHAISGKESFAQLLCMKESKLCCIPVEDLLSALRILPNFCYEVLRFVAGKALTQVQLTVISRRKKTRDRIASFLFLHYNDTKEDVYSMSMTIGLLAKTLNLTRSALSKELHQLESEGAISIQKDKILLTDINILEDELFF